jgi:hypothetical protein
LAPAQAIWPAGQQAVGALAPQLAAHRPAVQLWPAGQALPQAPQLFGSSVRLAQ